MYENTEQPSESTTARPLVKQPAGYAIFLRWVLPHILLLSPGLIAFVWSSTLYPTSPSACLALPFIIGGAFAAQVIGIARVFKQIHQYLLWILAFGVGFAIMFVTLFFQAVLGSSAVYQSPWGVAFIGAIFGLIESLVLFVLYKRAWWWIAANAVGLTVGTFLAMNLSASIRALCRFAPSTNPDCGYTPFVYPIAIGVAVFSIITGATLVWITRTTSREPATRSAKIKAAVAALLVFICLFLFNTYYSLPQQLIDQAAKHAESIFLSDIDMISPQEGWAVGGDSGSSRNAVIFHYTGNTWAEIDVPASKSTSNLDSVSMLSETEGWAVGAESTFLHYTNGTWTKVAPPTGMSSAAYIVSIEMLTPSNGWAIAQDYNTQDPDLQNALLHYDGTQWNYVQPNIAPRPVLTHLSFSTPDDGWAIGGTTTITGVVGTTLHYTGGTWQNVESNMSAVPNAIQMLSPDDGWALSSNHTVGTTIFHYNQGNWSQSAFFSDLTLPSLTIISPQEGWAIGYVDKSGPTIPAMARYDGTNWTQTPEGTSIPIIGRVSMVSETEGWTIGGHTFYHYKNGTWTPNP